MLPVYLTSPLHAPQHEAAREFYSLMSCNGLSLLKEGKECTKQDLNQVATQTFGDAADTFLAASNAVDFLSVHLHHGNVYINF